RHKDGHIDLPRLKEGGVDLVFFACFPSPQYISRGPEDPDSCAWVVRRMIDSLRAQARRNGQEMAIVTSGTEAERVIQSGRIAAAIGVEGGHSLQNSLDTLETLYHLGVRYLTLTWVTSTDWATSSADESSGKELPFRGLTEFGKRVVRRMNELGMLVDVSHVGERTFWDVMETSTAPVIASHSSVYAICPVDRNLKDEQIRAIAAKGGVILINFYAGYLDSTYESKRRLILERHRTELDSLREHLGADSPRFRALAGELLRPELERVRPPLEVLIDHIDYVARLVGVDYVGLGSDFDGISVLPQEIQDASCLPVITRELIRRGYSPDAICKILGGNLLRVFRQVCG
ncbi:MAG: dipeptidase, partial [candidate division KSB1 bacterium]|nr:dipeptidase [candidate division KSB1 bacterium]